MVYDVPIEETIMNEKDIHLFMGRTKVPRSSSLYLINEDGSRTQLQNITRFYISKSGGELLKVMPPIKEYELEWDCVPPEGDKKTEVERVDTKGKMETRKRNGWEIIEVFLPPKDREFAINKGQYVFPCNDIKSFKGVDDIDYQWYIDEANKLVNFEGLEQGEDDED